MRSPFMNTIHPREADSAIHVVSSTCSSAGIPSCSAKVTNCTPPTRSRRGTCRRPRLRTTTTNGRLAAAGSGGGLVGRDTKSVFELIHRSAELLGHGRQCLAGPEETKDVFAPRPAMDE